jgi:hypothetical protein
VDQKTFSILSILGLALRSTPALHHHFIIHPVLLILCLIDVKELFHMIIPVEFITRLFIESLTYLCEPCTVRYELFIQVVDNSW